MLVVGGAANKGIGFDIARILAENGLRTVVTSRNGKPGKPDPPINWVHHMIIPV